MHNPMFPKLLFKPYKADPLLLHGSAFFLYRDSLDLERISLLLGIFPDLGDMVFITFSDPLKIQKIVK